MQDIAINRSISDAGKEVEEKGGVAIPRLHSNSKPSHDLSAENCIPCIAER